MLSQRRPIGGLRLLAEHYAQGCGENCPYVPGARYRDWPLDDPKGQDDATVRRVIADIDTRVRDLIHELVPDHDLPPSLLV